MRLLLDLARWEWRFQLRSWRFRIGALVHLAVAGGFSVLFQLTSRDLQVPTPLSYRDLGAFLQPDLGPATCLAVLIALQLFPTVFLAVLAAGGRSTPDDFRRLAPILSSARLSSGTYLFGRWLALFVVLLPVVLLPPAVNAGLLLARGETVDPTTWLLTWTLSVGVLLASALAAWLGLVTIFQSELAAVGLSIVGVELAFLGVNQLLFSQSLKLVAPSVLTTLEGLYQGIAVALSTATGNASFLLASIAWRSELPADPAVLLQRTALFDSLGLVLAVLTLATAAVYLKRSRPNQKPPGRLLLRTFSRERILRWQELLRPSAALARGDRLLAAAAALAVAGVAASQLAYQQHQFTHAREKYTVLTADPVAPMSSDLVPRTWNVRGTIAENGTVDLDVEAVLVNEGSQEQRHLAFEVNPWLRARGHEQHRLQQHRERLAVELAEAAAPGAEIRLRLHLEGRPGQRTFPFWSYRRDSFVTRFRRHLNPEYFYDVADLRATEWIPAVTPRGATLRARDLMPVPRTTPWTLDERGQVPPEQVRRGVELDLELAVPPSWTLADVCGNLSPGAGAHLAGRCRVDFEDYRVQGLAAEPFAAGSEVRAAFLPRHRRAAEELAAEVTTTIERAERAWPGMADAFHRIVLLETADERHNRVVPEFAPSFEYPQAGDHLWLLSEHALGMGSLPRPGPLVAERFQRHLLSRRSLREEDAKVLTKIVEALVARRMGLDIHPDARVGGRPDTVAVLRGPILDPERHDEWAFFEQPVWKYRLPAVLFDLQNRIGEATLYDALETFLNRPPEDGEGTFDGFVAVLEKESGRDLRRFVDDFFRGDALPELEIRDPRTVRRGRLYEVRGELHNLGTGEVVCPVGVRSAGGWAWTTVQVGTTSQEGFAVEVEMKPLEVVLDPRGTCHRLTYRLSDAVERHDLLDRP